MKNIRNIFFLFFISLSFVHGQGKGNYTEINVGSRISSGGFGIGLISKPGIILNGDHKAGGRIELGGKTSNPDDKEFKQTNIVLEANDKSNEGANVYLRDFSGTQVIILDANEVNDGIVEGASIKVNKPNGSTGIELDADYGEDGDARVITDELEIKGGSDLAENFDIVSPGQQILPGMVVSIDPSKTGKLRISDQLYDKKVAGIISGANGIETGFFMGQEGSIADGEYPIALTGRVYVYANNEGGEIKPGDFITTSSTHGYAMRVNDYLTAQGAIIGKAMSGIDKNGFVLVLVNLQ